MTKETKKTPPVIRLKDYQPPAYWIRDIRLDFDLHEEFTRVKSVMQIVRNKAAALPEDPLVLNGEHMKLRSVKLNGRPLPEAHYLVTDTALTIPEVPEEFSLEIENDLSPHKNKALEGLYISGGMYCTQNEPQGFRKITYFIDRPDVMARYTTTVRADKKKYPVLLANGNPTAEGDLPHGRHFVMWEDPFPKPSYLFALVAGDLGSIQDIFTTRSGRKVDLRIYVDKGNEYKCEHAMDSLKKAMKWDEDVFGLECDLNTYMIVAVDAFNFGAMENKGLNIFNSQYVLADPKTATDTNYEGILGVIGHEYFHNWTGNRVTCRDWFQITLKEGLTVFRDQEFSADMTSRAVKRIEEVRMIKDHQFAEDSGPNAHAIRPPEYIQVNNFYTVTVYHKGAEVIRMIETLIGSGAFRKGITKYFELFDGQAVTTEDFILAMEKASNRDFTQFKRWYSQTGTAICRVNSKYDPKTKTFVLTIEQCPPKTLKPQEAAPLHFPFTIGLLSKQGEEFPLRLAGADSSKTTVKSRVLEITQWKETFVFENVPSEPVPSLLRNFSAPVKVEYDYTESDLQTLLSHDTDPVNRYEAGQILLGRSLNELILAHQEGRPMQAKPELLDAFGRLIMDQSSDPAFCAEALVLPSLASLTESMEACDFEAAFAAREYLRAEIARVHHEALLEIYEMLHDTGPYSFDPESIGRRTLKNTALAYLSVLKEPEVIRLAVTQFREAAHMTDEITALEILCQSGAPEADEALQTFYTKWNQNVLVMNKWFAVQASSKQPGTLKRVQGLERDPAFDAENPNKIRALYGAFAQNLIHFHEPSGAAYGWIADKILEIDRFNPSAAAKLSGAFRKFACLDSKRQGLMRNRLERILSREKLSPDVYEIISKTLESAARQKSPANALR